jgi:hypothetical protein
MHKSQVVRCDPLYDQAENEHGRLVPCVYVECPLCGHCTMSYGTSERSIKRCLALLREQCPEAANYFYTVDDDEWEGEARSVSREFDPIKYV